MNVLNRSSSLALDLQYDNTMEIRKGSNMHDHAYTYTCTASSRFGAGPKKFPVDLNNHQFKWASTEEQVEGHFSFNSGKVSFLWPAQKCDETLDVEPIWFRSSVARDSPACLPFQPRPPQRLPSVSCSHRWHHLQPQESSDASWPSQVPLLQPGGSKVRV